MLAAAWLGLRTTAFGSIVSNPIRRSRFTMRRFFPLVAALPFTTGCMVVNRYALINPSQFSAPVTEGNLAACLFLVAACCGGMGGIVAWLTARGRRKAA